MNRFEYEVNQKEYENLVNTVYNANDEQRGSDSIRRKPGTGNTRGRRLPLLFFIWEKFMPTKPKHPCGYPGCPRLTDGQYCEEHQKLVTKQYNRYQRDEFSKNFYKTPEWKLTRRRHLAAHPFCEECLKAGKRTKATMVDHIVPIKQGGDKFAECNLQSLCWSCHSRKSAEEGSRWGNKS